jgi:signal transduction histidine kinase
MIERAKNLAQEILAETRRLMHALRLAALDDLGLVPAIRSYVAEQLEKSGVKVEISQRGDVGRLPREIELTLFRIAQEAINNVARHAHAAKVIIEVSGNEEFIEMSVLDDGRGIEVNSEEDRDLERGLGIQGMRERSRLLGGRTEIESEPGGNASVYADSDQYRVRA